MSRRTPATHQSDRSRVPVISRGRILWLWLPLALSFTFMMLEGPTVQAAISRLGDPALNLAAFGLVLSISLIIESPVIMLIATAIALSRDAQSYRALRRFVAALTIGLTVLTALVAWTPLYDLVVLGLLRIPSETAEAARPAFRIMLLWTAAIGWRRFWQGILVQHGLSARVSYGTALRLGSALLTAIALVMWGGLPGATVGAIVLMVGVITEALATYVFVAPVLGRSYRMDQTSTDQISTDQPLSTAAITRFHLPLAGTSLLTLLVQPLTQAALARLALPNATLAAFPVLFSVLLVLRGWGMALQETTIAQASDPQVAPALRSFTLIVAVVTSLVAALLALTPLLDLYLDNVVRLAPDLRGLVRLGLQISILLPALTAITSWLRGLLMAAKTPASVYRGMGVNLAIHALVLFVGVTLNFPGIVVAATALLLAISGEYVYLHNRYRSLGRAADQSLAAAPTPLR